MKLSIYVLGSQLSEGNKDGEGPIEDHSDNEDDDIERSRTFLREQLSDKLSDDYEDDDIVSVKHLSSNQEQLGKNKLNSGRFT